MVGQDSGGGGCWLFKGNDVHRSNVFMRLSMAKKSSLALVGLFQSACYLLTPKLVSPAPFSQEEKREQDVTEAAG